MNSIYSKISFRAAEVALGVGLATVGMFLVSGVASAATVTSLPNLTDDDFDGLIDSGEFTEVFVAEGRVGNNSLNTAERELGINDKAGNPVKSAQFEWGNGIEYDFTLNYDGSMVNYNVGGTLLSSQAFSDPIDTIYIRTKSVVNGNTSSSFSKVEGKSFNNLPLSFSSVAQDGGVNYLRISDISESFELKGTVSFSWTGDQPTRSNLAYQIQVGNSEPVPEPLTILGSGVALGFGAFLKKESSRKQNKVK
ncbi:PEP-CTERM sorting domain-containing protein [Coleofasciculus sp. G2-EDA-02]|uniref:PEP-CTERM sorting domain-containing protein n=1 Tax=Coleofasciculus sp. G2-EDA-02 TaxID=3069529 RepID=UPI0032F69261